MGRVRFPKKPQIHKFITMAPSALHEGFPEPQPVQTWRELQLASHHLLSAGIQPIMLDISNG